MNLSNTGDLHPAEQLSNPDTEKPVDTAAIVQFADNYVENLLLTINTGRAASQEKEHILSTLADIVGDTVENDKGIITIALQKATETFLETVVETLYQKKHSEQVDITGACRQLYDQLFSMSPSLFETVSAEQHIRLAAIIGRIPELQQSIIRETANELVYNIQVSKRINAQRLQHIGESLPIQDRFSYVQLLERLAWSAYHGGEWSERAYQRVVDATKRIAASATSVLERYAAEQVVDRLAYTSDETMLSPPELANDAHETAASLARAYTFDIPIPEGHTMCRVSKEYIGIKDAMGRIQYLGHITAQDATPTDSHPDTTPAQPTEVQALLPKDVLSNPRVRPIISDNPRDVEGLLFEQMHMPYIAQKIEADFGMSLGQIPLREQIQVLHTFASLDTAQYQRVQALFQREHVTPESLIQLLFATSIEGITLDELISMLEQTPADILVTLGNSYAKAIAEIDNIQTYIADFFTTRTTAVDPRNVVIEMISRWNKKLLHTLRQESPTVATIAAEFDHLYTDTVQFASIFKIAFSSEQPPSFEDIRGMTFESTSTISPAEQLQMERVIQANYQGNPLLEGVLTSFQEAIERGTSDFYVLKKDGLIISFDRFEPIGEADDNTVEFASFNTDPRYQQSSIGKAMMERTVAEYSQEKQKTIYAQTDPESPICQYYIQKMGFVISGVTEYKSTGRYVFDITKYPDANIISPTDTQVVLGTRTEMIAHIQSILETGSVINGFFFRDGVYTANIADLSDQKHQAA